MRKRIAIKKPGKPPTHPKRVTPINARELKAINLEIPSIQEKEILESINMNLQARLRTFPETAKLERTELLIDLASSLLNNFYGNLVGGYRRIHLASHRKLYESENPEFVKQMDEFHEKIDLISREIGFDCKKWSKEFHDQGTGTKMQTRYLKVWPLFVELLKRGFTLRDLVS